MTRAKRVQRRKTIQTLNRAKPILERWRKNLSTVVVELKQPRVIDVVPIDFVGGEPVERQGKPRQKFQGQLIYVTNDDVTIRRPSGAILVIDNYEIVVISAGLTRFKPS
jgi:hypothetical protein